MVKNVIKWVKWVFGGSGGSVWVMGEWSVGQWIVVVISFQKMYGLYGLKHHTVEMLPCGTYGRRRTTTNDEQTREDKATQPLDAGRLSFAIIHSSKHEKCDCGQDGELADATRLVILKFNQSVISPLHLLQAT